MVSVKIAVALHDYGTWLSLDNGANYHPIVYAVSGRPGNWFNGAVVTLRYDKDGTASVYAVNGAMTRSTATGVWRVLTLYDSGNTNDTSVMYIRAGNGTYKTTTQYCRYVMAVIKDDTTLIPINSDKNSSNNNGTTSGHTITTEAFQIFQPFIYNTNDATYAANASVGIGGLWYAHAAIDLRYSFNITTSTFTSHKTVYIKATLQTPTTAKFDTTNPVTQTLPNNDDGFIYIKLGRAYSGYQIALTYDHPIYWFKDGAIRQYNNNFTIADTTNTLYLVGVTSTDSSILKRNTNITMNGEKLKLIPTTDTGVQITLGQNNTNRWGLCSDASSNSTNFRIYSYNSSRSMIECYHNGEIRVRHQLLAIPTADQEAEIGVYTNAEGTNKLYLFRQSTASQTNSGLYCNGLDNENNTIGTILYNDSVTSRYSGRLEWLQLGHWYDEMLRIKSRHPWPYIRFDSVASTTSNPTYDTYNLNLLGQLVFQNYIKKKDNSEAYGATFFFRTYSVNSSNNTKTNYYEDFSLPNVPNNLTASATYDIITGKGGNLRANLYRLVNVSRAVAPSAHTYAAYEYISSTNRARLAIMEYMKAQEGYQRLNFYLLADTASANNYGGLYIRGNYQDATANVCGFNISTGIFTAPKVYNAVWNDYAECRKASTSEPGRVITESTFGTMQLASERLMPGCKIISDTYGTLMGESDEAKTPIAVAGRVLVYPYKDKKYYHLGDAVCSAPNGTIDIMSREEIMMFPERIIGTVSEIPAYEEWEAGAKENPISIKVNGRIWIYVR